MIPGPTPSQYPLSALARRLVAPFRTRLDRKLAGLNQAGMAGGSQQMLLSSLFFEVLAMLDSGELPGDEVTRVASDFGVEYTDVLTALAVYLLNQLIPPGDSSP